MDDYEEQKKANRWTSESGAPAIRAEQNGGAVPQGHREDTVFCAMNFAVIAGLVNVGDERDFNELAQSLIEN